jgi:hypothetical protein
MMLIGALRVYMCKVILFHKLLFSMILLDWFLYLWKIDGAWSAVRFVFRLKVLAATIFLNSLLSYLDSPKVGNSAFPLLATVLLMWKDEVWLLSNFVGKNFFSSQSTSVYPNMPIGKM